MNNLYIITGPAGVGKSTVSKELASRKDKSALIEGDEIYSQVIGGYVSAWKEGNHLVLANVLQDLPALFQVVKAAGRFLFFAEQGRSGAIQAHRLFHPDLRFVPVAIRYMRIYAPVFASANCTGCRQSGLCDAPLV